MRTSIKLWLECDETLGFTVGQSKSVGHIEAQSHSKLED